MADLRAQTRERSIRFCIVVCAKMSCTGRRDQLGVCVNTVTKCNQLPLRKRDTGSRAHRGYPSEVFLIRDGDRKGTSLNYFTGTFVITATTGFADLLAVKMIFARGFAQEIANRGRRLSGATSLYTQPPFQSSMRTPNRVMVFRMMPVDLAGVKKANPDTCVYAPEQFPGLWGHLKHIKSKIDALTPQSFEFAKKDPNALVAAGGGGKNNAVFIIFAREGLGHGTGIKNVDHVGPNIQYIYDTVSKHPAVSPPESDARNNARLREFKDAITNNVTTVQKWHETPAGIAETKRADKRETDRVARVDAAMHAAVDARHPKSVIYQFVDPILCHIRKYGAHPPPPPATWPVTHLDVMLSCAMPLPGHEHEDALERDMRKWYKYQTRCPVTGSSPYIRPFFEHCRVTVMPEILERHNITRSKIANATRMFTIIYFLVVYMRADAYAYYREPYVQSGCSDEFDWRMGAMLIAAEQSLMNTTNHADTLSALIEVGQLILFIWSAEHNNIALQNVATSLMRTYADSNNYTPFPIPGDE